MNLFRCIRRPDAAPRAISDVPRGADTGVGLCRWLVAAMTVMTLILAAPARSQTVLQVTNSTFSGTIPLTQSGTTYDWVQLLGTTTINGAVVLGDAFSDGVLEFSTSGLNVVSNSISGTGAVIVTTTGTVRLTAANTYVGGATYGLFGTLVRDGVLDVATGGSISHTGADLFVGEDAGDDGTLSITGGSVAAKDVIVGHFGASQGTLTMSAGSLSTDGSLIIGADADGNGLSTGVATITGGTATVGSVLEVGHGGSGSLTMTGGSLTSAETLVGINAGSNGNISVSGSATLTTTGNMSVGYGVTSGTLSVGSGGTVTVGGELSGAGTTTVAAGGILRSGTGGSGGTVTTNVTNNGQMFFNTSGTSTFSNVISGSGTLTKQGSGEVTIDAAQTYSGGTTVQGGALRVSAQGSITHANAAMTVSSGGSLVVEGGGVVSGDSSVSGTASVTSGGSWTTRDLTLSGAGALSIESNGIVVTTGTLASSGTSATVSVHDGTLQIGDSGATGHLAANVSTSGSSAAVTFIRSGTETFSHAIWGTGAVNIQGGTAGPLTLLMTGTSNYTGATNVGDFAGLDTAKLYVNGELGQTAVQVNAGSTLGGTGLVGGTVTVADTGIISPGSIAQPVASLTVGGLDLSAGTGVTTQMTVNGLGAGTGYDQVLGVSDTTSALTYGGDLQLDFNGNNYANFTVFHLFSNFTPGSMAGSNFNSITLSGSSDFNGLTFTLDPSTGVWTSGTSTGGQFLEFTPGTGNLVVVPEPSTLLLAAAGFGVAGLVGWRRRGAGPGARALGSSAGEAVAALPDKSSA